MISLVGAYGALALLLVSLNLTSLWRWWIKAAAIVTTTALVGVTYQGLNDLMGWPTAQRPAVRFALIASRIAEPDRKNHTDGSIYLWASELDRNNVPAEVPRSYQLPYTAAMARKVADAQEKRDHGVEVMGMISELQGQERKRDKSDKANGGVRNQNGQQSPSNDTVPFTDNDSEISFEDLPPVLLPEKEAE